MIKDQKKSFNTRVTIFQIFLFFFAALLASRLFVVSVVEHNFYYAKAQSQHGYSQTLLPTRGEIFISDKYAQDPYPVATNASLNMAYVLTKDLKDPQTVAQTLSAILGMDKQSILDKITDPKKQYVILMHNLSDDQSTQVQNAKLAGVYLSPEQVRYYPEGNFLSQVLGFIGFKDNTDQRVGLYGIEKYLEDELAGQAGTVATEADFNGNWITGSKLNFKPSV